ncbi:unknown [Clostridium sp. CAG:448]|nr:unknown [Clostridium sp. CAG:448]
MVTVGDSPFGEKRFQVRTCAAHKGVRARKNHHFAAVLHIGSQFFHFVQGRNAVGGGQILRGVVNDQHAAILRNAEIQQIQIIDPVSGIGNNAQQFNVLQCFAVVQRKVTGFVKCLRHPHHTDCKPRLAVVGDGSGGVLRFEGKEILDGVGGIAVAADDCQVGRGGNAVFARNGGLFPDVQIINGDKIVAHCQILGGFQNVVLHIGGGHFIEMLFLVTEQERDFFVRVLFHLRLDVGVNIVVAFLRNRKGHAACHIRVPEVTNR